MYSYSTFSGLNEFRSDAHGEELILVRRILCSPKAVVQKTFAPPPFCPGGPSFETSNATHTAWPIPRAPTLPSPHTTFPQDLLARRMVLCLPVEVPGFLTKPAVSSVIVTRAVSTASPPFQPPTPHLTILWLAVSLFRSPFSIKYLSTFHILDPVLQTFTASRRKQIGGRLRRPQHIWT